MNSPRIAAMLLCAAALAACDKNAVQQLPTQPLLGAQIKFFNFGVSAPGVNFYADQTKMTAIQSGTGSEATTGVAYGGVGNGGAYSTIAAGSHTVTGRIAAVTDNGLAIATISATIADGKSYSVYMSGFYDPVGKTVDGFVVEDAYPPQIDWTTAQVRFVHAIANANPLSLYAANTTTSDTVAIGGSVAYKSGGAFVAVPPGVYNLLARYTGSATNKITRTAVSFLGGRVYTIGARGDTTVTSSTATNRPFLDYATNR